MTVGGALNQGKERLFYAEVDTPLLDATLLLEPDIPYDTMVQVMDNLRAARVVQAGSLQTAELFPDISIGDAPADSLQVAASDRVKSQ